MDYPKMKDSSHGLWGPCFMKQKIRKDQLAGWPLWLAAACRLKQSLNQIFLGEMIYDHPNLDFYFVKNGPSATNTELKRNLKRTSIQLQIINNNPEK